MIDDKTLTLVNMIRQSEDPGKAVNIALDLMTRLVAGESPESIAASHGINWEEVVACRQKKN